ncbi:MAG: HDOD domain-containing protein, partial [Methanothrix sp.]|nr:HDOD domain-containing protein [Methanothrix sp.]
LVRRVWDHAKAIAQGCRRIAEEYHSEIRPSNAYLVGLLHELDSLPILLGWESKRRISCNSEPAGLRLAKVWSLPGCVLEYFMELSDPRSTTQWTELLEQAHAMQNICSPQLPRRDQTTPRALESVRLQSVAL